MQKVKEGKKDGHISVPGYLGGIKLCAGGDGHCLHRHIGEYKEGDDCSHRWQGYRRALDDSSVYNFPAYKELVGETDTEQNRQAQGLLYRGRYAFLQRFPQSSTNAGPARGSWDLDADHVVTILGTSNHALVKNAQSATVVRQIGTTTSGATRNEYQVSYPNFRKRSWAPYWHEAHHLITQSLLTKTIIEISTGDDQAIIQLDPDERLGFGLLALTCLTESGYNINHKVNMILLPQTAVVSRALKLPVHTTQPSHTRYDDEVVRPELMEIFSEIAKNLDGGAHPDLDEFSTDIREQLEAISESLYESVKDIGALRPGESLNQVSVEGPA